MWTVCVRVTQGIGDEVTTPVIERLLCLAIGYVCGCVLTADIVARAKTGRHIFDQGSGNPGMANAGSLFGVKWAAVVLGGDILKTVVAYVVSWALFWPLGQPLVALWCGLGVTVGHNFPFWCIRHGGKGVTTTCSTIILADPLWGVVASVVGLAVTAITKYLPLGAIVIPVVFLLPAVLVHGSEAFTLTLILALLMLLRHGKPALNALRGVEPQADIVSKVRRK